MSLAPPPAFAPDERDRLLASVVELLSGRDPVQGEGLDRHALHQYLWEFSGRQMPLALTHAGRISSREARFDASRALASADREAYVTARRPVQLIAGLALVLAAAAAARLARYRRAAGALAASAALWTLWSAVTQDASELPPTPYMFVTAGFIAFMTGGLMVAMAATAWRAVPGAVAALGRVVLLGIAAAVVALALCAWTYRAGIMPETHEGWSAMLAPLASGMMAGLWGSVLALVDVLLSRRHLAPSSAI